MNKYLRKLWNMSLAKVWEAITKPRLFFALLTAPDALSNVDAILSLFPKLTLSEVKKCKLEFLTNNNFFTELNTKMVHERYRRVICEGWNEFLYMIVRFAKPQILFETGVFDGQSSAVILQALYDNGSGMLVSVDLPAIKNMKWSTYRMREPTLPPNCRPGWVIPDYLRNRHRLILGDSRLLLPQLFKQYPKIDIFFHDSLHTFKHQHFEYRTAWPHLSEGGFLLSDDIFWSSAYHRFCKEKNRKYINISGFGAVMK